MQSTLPKRERSYFTIRKSCWQMYVFLPNALFEDSRSNLNCRVISGSRNLQQQLERMHHIDKHFVCGVVHILSKMQRVFQVSFVILDFSLDS